MDMNLLKLIAIFAVVVVIIWLKMPLYRAFLAGTVAAVILCRIPVRQSGAAIWGVVTNWGKMAIVLNLYLITYLQRLLDQRRQIQLAQKDMISLFNNRVVNATLIPIVIGFLPSPAALVLCGRIVDEATGASMDAKQKAFTTSYFRHIPESFLPTYASVLLLTQSSGFPISRFVLVMIPTVVVLFLAGWFFYLRKLPKLAGEPDPAVNRRRALLNLFGHLWSLILILVLIMGFGLAVELSVGIVLVLCFFVYRVTPQELAGLLPKAFDKVMLLSTLAIFIFQSILSQTGVIDSLIRAFRSLPLPTVLVFTLLLFVGGILSGTQSIIAVAAPIAFAAVPGYGLPLVMLFACFAWAANQISPTHVCVVVAANYFKVNFSDMVKKSLPCLAVYLAFATAYYFLLNLFL